MSHHTIFSHTRGRLTVIAWAQKVRLQAAKSMLSLATGLSPKYGARLVMPQNRVMLSQLMQVRCNMRPPTHILPTVDQHHDCCC